MVACKLETFLGDFNFGEGVCACFALGIELESAGRSSRVLVLGSCMRGSSCIEYDVCVVARGIFEVLSWP